MAKVTTKISAAGNNRSGFTLIEILVVMTIIGIMTAVTVNMMGDQRQTFVLRQESERLRDMLRMAATDAVLHGREWGVILAPGDYRFVYYDNLARQWTDADIAALGQYTLPDSLTLTLDAANRLNLAAAAGQPPPDILLLSSGQTSAFAMTLQLRSDARQNTLLASDGRSGILLDENGHAKNP